MSRSSSALIAAACLAAAAYCGPALAADLPSPAARTLEIQKASADARETSARFDSSRCAVPASLTTQDQSLPYVGFKLRNDLPIKIVAVGSSSTQGHGASSPSQSYPARLAVELAELWPRARLTVVNSGVGGERTAQMMARFERDVLAFAVLVLFEASARLPPEHSDNGIRP